MPGNSTDQSDPRNIYAYMAHMYTNAENTIRNYGYISQLTNFILDSGATFNMTSDLSDFIPVSLVETDKYIEVADGHFLTAKQTGEVQIKMLGDNVKPFIATLYNALFSPDL